VETLYSHERHCARIRRFLDTRRPRHKVRYPVDRDDVQATLMVIWRLGIKGPGRRHFWRLFTRALRHPRDRRVVLKLLGLGYHFRKVSAEMSPAHRPRPNDNRLCATESQGARRAEDSRPEAVGRRP
jgi:hypothetical protein